jgi:transposase
MSRHSFTGGDIAGLFACFAALRQKATRRKSILYPLVVIQEAGLDGFWLGRVLSKEAWIESHIVEAASIAMPRQHRRAKTDRIDGETLIRAPENRTGNCYGLRPWIRLRRRNSMPLE